MSGTPHDPTRADEEDTDRNLALVEGGSYKNVSTSKREDSEAFNKLTPFPADRDDVDDDMEPPPWMRGGAEEQALEEPAPSPAVAPTEPGTARVEAPPDMMQTHSIHAIPRPTTTKNEVAHDDDDDKRRRAMVRRLGLVAVVGFILIGGAAGAMLALSGGGGGSAGVMSGEVDADGQPIEGGNKTVEGVRVHRGGLKRKALPPKKMLQDKMDRDIRRRQDRVNVIPDPLADATTSTGRTAPRPEPKEPEPEGAEAEAEAAPAPAPAAEAPAPAPEAPAPEAAGTAQEAPPAEAPAPTEPPPAEEGEMAPPQVYSADDK